MGIRMLEPWIQAAGLHAANEHQVAGELDIADVDQILVRERESQRQEALVPCYGAWFGQYVLDRLPGYWIGLDEPVAPRICLAGVAYSPFDAVARRLADPRAASLQELFDRLLAEATNEPAPSVADVVVANRSRWDELAKQAKFVNSDWFPPDARQARAAMDPWLRAEGVAGKQLLCLAAGGGTHAGLHAAAGAHVTVVDFSAALLEWDIQLARRHGLQITTLCCAMDALPSDLDGRFDIVLQPTSLCYVPDPLPVFHALARVLRPGGLYIVQNKNSTSLRTAAAAAMGYPLSWMQRDGRALPPANNQPQRETGMIEFAHSHDLLIGGLCRSGFVIEDYREPPRGDGWDQPGSAAHRALYAPPYFKIKARRVDAC